VHAYNLFRPFYGLWSALLEGEALTGGLALAKPQTGERVLEVGTGQGRRLLFVCMGRLGQRVVLLEWI
jgi:protein-L-isoaspartate O-methyltransferase